VPSEQMDVTGTGTEWVSSRWQDLGEERFQRLLYADGDVRRRQKIYCIYSAGERATRLCSEIVVAEGACGSDEGTRGGRTSERERRASEVG